MSDGEDDYMCEDEEDYGLVSYLYMFVTRRRIANLTFCGRNILRIATRNPM